MARKVCVLTSAHPAFDVRIFHKECKSLARAGYDVVLAASDCKAGICEGIDLIPLPHWKSRFDRLTHAPFVVYKIARKIKADIYHFHDPELIPAALMLRLTGKKVIYDIHEDLPRTISYKPYIPESLKGPLSRVVEPIEEWAAARCSALVTADPNIGDRFRGANRNLAVVNNYPKIEEIEIPSAVAPIQRETSMLYLGMRITRARGIEEMVRATGLLPASLQARLRLVGAWDPPDLPNVLSGIPGWDRVDFAGPLGRTEVARELHKARVGLVVLHPEPNYVMAQPVKLYEYMCAGIPVIASDFPVCREIVDHAGCGILVDPLNPEEIASAMAYLLTHPEEAEAMGQRGYRAIHERYNWANEEKTLLQFYSRLLRDDAAYQKNLIGGRQAT